MAVQLTTNEKRINDTQWNATGGNPGYYLYTRQYAYYEMINTTTARVHIRQVVGSVSGRGWEGTNNHYRTKSDPDTIIDSGYKTFGIIGANQELQLWSGTYDITNSSNVNIMCFASTYGETYQTTSWTDIYVPAAAFAVAPTTPTVSATATSGSTIEVTYGTTSFGTPASGVVTLYGGTSSSPTSEIDHTNSTGDKTFTFTNLNPNTTYYFRARANNGTLQSNYSSDATATTLDPIKFYGSVNGETKAITKLYGSVNGQTKLITKLYGSVNGQTKRIF